MSYDPLHAHYMPDTPFYPYLLDSSGTLIVLSGSDLTFDLEGACKELNRLSAERNFWKSDSCSYSNKRSILSNEVGILQETRNVDRFIKMYYKYIL